MSEVDMTNIEIEDIFSVVVEALGPLMIGMTEVTEGLRFDGPDCDTVGAVYTCMTDGMGEEGALGVTMPFARGDFATPGFSGLLQSKRVCALESIRLEASCGGLLLISPAEKLYLETGSKDLSSY